MEKKVGELTDKIGDITKKVGVYTGSQKIMWMLDNLSSAFLLAKKVRLGSYHTTIVKWKEKDSNKWGKPYFVQKKTLD